MSRIDRRTALAGTMAAGVSRRQAAPRAPRRGRRPQPAAQLRHAAVAGADRGGADAICARQRSCRRSDDPRLLLAGIHPQARRLRRAFAGFRRLRDEDPDEAQILRAPHLERLDPGEGRPRVQRMLLFRAPPPRDQGRDGRGGRLLRGRYLDFLERRGGVWKIIRRRGLSDYTADPIPANTPFAAWPAGTHTERNHDDEWYRMLTQFDAS